MKLALKLLFRNWRSGELNILIVSLILAVSTITAISLFTSRLENSIGDEIATFFAGDARIRSSIPIPKEWIAKATDMELTYATATGYRAMTFSEGGMQLSAVKGVSDAYPLKGELEVSDKPFAAASAVTHGPAPGEVWLASRLFAALDIEINEKLNIGEAEFTVTKALIREPDDTRSFFGVAPRALINIADISSTQAVQAGSRVNYALTLAGKEKNLADFKTWLEDKLGDHATWSDAKSGNRNLSTTLDRAEKFLLLAGSLSVILSSVAIALAARRYAQRHVSQVALLKTFGLSPKAISLFYFSQIFAIGVLCIFAGLLIGQLMHYLIIESLGNLIPENLSQASPGAYYIGVLCGMVSLFAFAAPPLLGLKLVPPMRVLQQIPGADIITARKSFAIGFAAISLLVFAFAQDLQLSLILIVGTTTSLLGVSFFSWLLIRFTKNLSQNLSPSWRLGIANLHRHKSFNVVQVMIFATLLMLMLILVLVRTSLIDQWKDLVPENAPNHFIFNIFNHEIDDVKQTLANADIPSQPFYPMLRGRVIEVNGTEVKQILGDKEQRMNYKRELNLTWASTLGEDNKILAGTWHGEGNRQTLEVSAEEEYAQGLKLKIGDTLIFSVAGSRFEAKLTSIRSVKWDSMNPNFFMIFNKPVLNGSATNWLTSAYLSPDKKLFINDLAKKFPTVSIIEVDQMISQVKDIIEQISMAIEFILILVLCAGGLIFVTSIQATLDIRLQESAILRTFGAKRSLVRNQLLIEFCTLGALAGILAALGTETCLYLLQAWFFETQFKIHWELWLFAVPLSAFAVGIVGWLSSRSVVYTAPLTVLRKV